MPVALPAASKSRQASGKAAVAAAKAPQKASRAVTAAWKEPDWNRLVGELGLSGAVRLLASNCAYLCREGNTVHLGLDPRSESLLTAARKDALAERLCEHFGESLKVDVALAVAADEASIETPVQEESRLADERMQAARRELEADPNVQAMKNMFGAEIKADTIELINPAQSD